MSTIDLQSVRNVRDLGGIRVCGDRQVKPGLIYRGGALAGISDEDSNLLFGQLGISHVVDLRCGYEVEAKPDRCPANVSCLWVPYFDEQEVGIDYFRPIPGTITIGRDFACDSIDFYATMANPLTVAQMRKAVHAILDSAAAGSPVYEHCSGGKDRAGVTAALVLTVLGADRDAIMQDYLLTNQDRDAHIQKTYERFLRLCQGDEAFARRTTEAHCARPENLKSFYAQVDALYGGMDAFVQNQLGFGDGQREELRLSCTCPRVQVMGSVSSIRTAPVYEAQQPAQARL